MDEKKFASRTIHEAFHVWTMRASAFGSFIFLFLIGLDYLVAPEHFREFLRYRIAIAAFLLIIAFSIKKIKKTRFDYFAAYMAVFWSALCIEAMILHLGGHRSPYYVGMILLGICIFGVIPAPMTFHLASASIIYLVYLIPIFLADKIVDYPSFVMANFFMVSIFGTGLFFRYLGMQTYKKEISLNYQMMRYQQQLENIVQQRTEELSRSLDSLSELAAAVQNTAEAVVITDTEGRIRYVNPAFERITGYTGQEVFNQYYCTLKTGNHETTLLADIQFRLKKGETWSGRIKGTKKDDSPYLEDVTISPILNTFGITVNFVIIKHDVTDNVRLESLAAALDTMKNIGYVFAGLRHEIANPINSMKAAIAVLKKDIDACTPDRILHMIDGISAGISQMEYLLKLMKNYGMFENPIIRDIDIDDFIDRFIILVEHDAAEKGIILKKDIDGIPRRGLADSRALQQVMLNIVTNAIDSVEQSHNPEICIISSGDARTTTIQVNDNGCGMGEKEMENIFRPFYTTKVHGTGLGLVIARKMLASMNCSIEIQSTKGTGTTVSISIPTGNSPHG